MVLFGLVQGGQIPGIGGYEHKDHVKKATKSRRQRGKEPLLCCMGFKVIYF